LYILKSTLILCPCWVTLDNFLHHYNINSICSYTYSWPICTQQLFLYHFIIPALDTQASEDQKLCFCVGLEKSCCHWSRHFWHYDPFNLTTFCAIRCVHGVMRCVYGMIFTYACSIALFSYCLFWFWANLMPMILNSELSSIYIYTYLLPLSPPFFKIFLYARI
jgi:hypothetical protein